MSVDISELIASRIGQDFDGECHLTEAEARALLEHITSLEAERDDARRQRDEIGRAWDEADARAKEAEARAASLEAALAEAREALAPFANMGAHLSSGLADSTVFGPALYFHGTDVLITVGDFRRAALSSSKQKDGDNG